MKTTLHNRILFILSMLAVSASALFFSACATVTATQKLNEVITPEQEYYIGRAVAANVLVSYKIQDNRPALTAYLNRVCNALVVNSPRPEIFNGYHVNILDSDEINAFATPGGHIFVTRSLIDSAESEDSLAAVVAHEIAHIQLQHGLGAINKSREQEVLAALGSDTSALLKSDLGKALEASTGIPVSQVNSAIDTVSEISKQLKTFGLSIGDIVTAMINNGYSREQEFAADSTALKLMAAAGYEPSSLVDMLKVLEKTQGAHPGGFNKTHPAPAQRIAAVQNSVGSYTIEDTRSYREARYAAAAK